MKAKLARNIRGLAAVAVAISGQSLMVSCANSSSNEPVAPPAASVPASQPISSHWVEDQRLRELMAELSKRNPTWPADLSHEPEDPAAAALAKLFGKEPSQTVPIEFPSQFDEIAALAHALSDSANHLPEIASRIQMSQRDRAGFVEEARNLREQAAQLEAAANLWNVWQMQRQMKAINATCTSCHSRYGGPVSATQESQQQKNAHVKTGEPP